MRILRVLLLSLFCLPALGQFSATVQGTVLDPGGATVPGATVKLTNRDTNISQTFTTKSSGEYFFNRLAPGPYSITVDARGFEKSVSEVILTTEQTAGVNFRLQIGSEQSTVTVSSEGSHDLNPDETRLQYTLSASEIEEFPLQNRSTIGLLRATPGATGINENSENVPVNRQSAGLSVGGRSDAGNVFILDNVVINSQLGRPDGLALNSGEAAITPHPDMIAEIALQATTFSVENGAGSGIQTSITTKSGTNLFHGDADYTYTGTPFAAIAPFEAGTTKFRRQYAGGALGGPILKNRTFFFGSYFNQQVGQPNTSLSTYFAPEFVAWASAAYPNSQNISQGLVPFPAARAVNVKTLLTGMDEDSAGCGTTPTSVPCATPVWNSASFAAPQTNNGAQYNFRLDHSMREGKDRVYASLLRFDQTSNSLRVQPTFDGSTPSTGYYLGANYTHQFSPSLLNEASFGQTRFNFDYTTTPHSVDLLKLPYIYGCTCAGLNVTQFLDNLLEHQTYGRDAVSWIKGKHNLTFGFQGSYINEFNDMSKVYGRPFFQADYRFVVTEPGVQGFTFDFSGKQPTSSFYRFLGDTTDDEQIYTLSAQTGKFIPQLFGAGSVRLGAYAQDSWRVSTDLLLTFGLRWDDFGNPSLYGKNAAPFSNVILAGGSTLPARVAGASSRLVSNVYSNSSNANFLPRGAFAYSPSRMGRKMTLRGGIGLYEDDLNLSSVATNIPTQPPVRLTLDLGVFGPPSPAPVTSYGTTTVQGPPGGNPYGFQFPSLSLNGFSSKGAPLDSNGNIVVGDLFGVARDLKPQSAILYNFGMEQEFPGHFIFGLNYSGSHGYDQLIQADANTYTGRAKSARYNTDFGQIKYYRNEGASNYNALIATARQTIGPLTYQASYTWGHSLGDPVGTDLTDQSNIRSQYTNSGSDIRNRFTLIQVYEVPARFASTWLNEALAGWSVSNSVVAQSGAPFTVLSTSSDFNNDGVKYDVPAYLGTKRSFSRTDFRASAYRQTSVFPLIDGASPFAAPSANTEGGLQNTFRGPNYFTLDTGLSKKFQLPWYGEEKATLALRGEAINILNRANYGSPSGNYDSTSTLGLVQSAYQGRVIQIGGRFQF